MRAVAVATPREIDGRARTPRKAARRPDIQGLRAVAVLLVVLGHAHVPLLAGGYVGVDVFFVISGFLITGWLLRRATETRRVPFGEFYGARARRILPAATLTLVATAVACTYLLNYVRAAAALRDEAWAAVFAANIHFSQVNANYFAADDPPSPIQHFWTLAVEEQFYLLWPLLLAGLLLLQRSARGAGRGPPRREASRCLSQPASRRRLSGRSTSPPPIRTRPISRPPHAHGSSGSGRSSRSRSPTSRVYRSGYERSRRGPDSPASWWRRSRTTAARPSPGMPRFCPSSRPP